eukprot:2054964-Rhodomonas_salina.1
MRCPLSAYARAMRCPGLTPCIPRDHRASCSWCAATSSPCAVQFVPACGCASLISQLSACARAMRDVGCPVLTHMLHAAPPLQSEATGRLQCVGSEQLGPAAHSVRYRPMRSVRNVWC